MTAMYNMTEHNRGSWKSDSLPMSTNMHGNLGQSIREVYNAPGEIAGWINGMYTQLHTLCPTRCVSWWICYYKLSVQQATAVGCVHWKHGFTQDWIHIFTLHGIRDQDVVAHSACSAHLKTHGGTGNLLMRKGHHYLKTQWYWRQCLLSQLHT